MPEEIAAVSVEGGHDLGGLRIRIVMVGIIDLGLRDACKIEFWISNLCIRMRG